MRQWEKNIRKVVPYTPGEQPLDMEMIKLNTNENPYPPAPAVEEMLGQMSSEAFRLYPDPKADQLITQIAAVQGVRKEQIFPGVGSDDVLAMSFLTFFNSNKPILFPDITYSFYSVWAELFGIPFKRPKLNERFEIVKEDYFQENGGIIFPNPNAPTGIALPMKEVEEIVRKNPDVIVIVDEAYVDFWGESAVKLIDRYDNLLVIQTFSKSRSMAGMRIGYAIGNETLIRYLNDVKYSFNSYTISQAAIQLGCAVLQEEEYFQKITEKIRNTREATALELKKLGFQMTDSKANFLFITHPRYEAEKLYQWLRKRHIYVRYFAVPRIDNYLRVTIGTEREMNRFLEEIKVFLAEN